MSQLISALNDLTVGLFGCVLSASFCNAVRSRRSRWIFACSAAVMFAFQAGLYFLFGPALLHKLYPLITHLPLWIVLCLLTKKRLWPLLCIFAAYLCCHLRRWLALLVITLAGGGAVAQAAVELAVTLPLLLLLLRFMAPAIRLLGNDSPRIQCQFGLIPMLGYGFDYLACIYTDLLYDGSPVVVEFMPFVCCVAYLIFILRNSAEEQEHSRMEQTQNSMNLQITQASREIALLRQAQENASTYRHDLRHHLQYISACIDSGKTEEAQAYIHEIFNEIGTHAVKIYCENEAVNLILSAFTGRAEAEGITLTVHASLSEHLAVTDSDLCVLLSNALENALRSCRPFAAQHLPCSIEVRMYEKAGRIFFQIVNPCSPEIVFKNGLPVTDAPGHGMGVQSICAIVKRYGGVYDFSAGQGKFILRLSL